MSALMSDDSCLFTKLVNPNFDLLLAYPDGAMDCMKITKLQMHRYKQISQWLGIYRIKVQFEIFDFVFT